MIQPQQARGARAMLRWTVAELSRKASVAANTIVRFEAEKGVHTRTVAAIQRALEAAGVEFLPDNGVRLKVSQVATPSAGSAPGGSSKPDQDAEPATSKPARPRKSTPRAKPAAMSKEAQLRALREQGAR